MTMIIYMIKYRSRGFPGNDDLDRAFADDFLYKLSKFDLSIVDLKYFNWIKEYRSTKIGTAESAGEICSGLRLFVEWIDLVIKFLSQFY